MRPGGVSDAASELNMSRQAFAKLRERPDFPDPIGDTSSGPIWNLDSLVSWAGSRSRLRAGRPPAEIARRQLGGRFEIEPEPIGVGGFATVYRALDLKTRQLVAVKVLNPGPDDSRQERFLQEAQLLEDFDNPHVMPVLGTGRDYEGNPWYAMPLASGSLLEELPFSADDEAFIIDVIRQICAGLATIHERVVHRDLKPQNILMVTPGVWAIADFGLARDPRREGGNLTGTYDQIGTPFWSAWEQWANAKDVTPSADIYSLGRILHALTLGGPPPDISEQPFGLFRHVIAKATRANPAARYQSVGDFFADFEATAKAATVPSETLPKQIARVSEQVTGAHPNTAILHEYSRLVMALSERDEQHDEFIHLVPLVSLSGIKSLWADDPETFRDVVHRFNTAIRNETRLQFAFCDTIADFLTGAIAIAQDPDILRESVASLVEVGARHNRFRVRSALLDVLRHISSPGDVVWAGKGLAEADPSLLAWSLNKFAVRSLSPAMREIAGGLLARNAA